MEIGDILTEQEILNGWLQFAGKEEGLVKYIRDGDAFLFKKVEGNKYQLYNIHALRPEFVYHR